MSPFDLAVAVMHVVVTSAFPYLLNPSSPTRTGPVVTVNLGHPADSSLAIRTFPLPVEPAGNLQQGLLTKPHQSMDQRL